MPFLINKVRDRYILPERLVWILCDYLMIWHYHLDEPIKSILSHDFMPRDSQIHGTIHKLAARFIISDFICNQILLSIAISKLFQTHRSYGYSKKPEVPLQIIMEIPYAIR